MAMLGRPISEAARGTGKAAAAAAAATSGEKEEGAPR